MQIALSAYWRHAAWLAQLSVCSRRAQRDASLALWFSAWQANFQVYGADKVWRQLNREGVAGRIAAPLSGWMRHHCRACAEVSRVRTTVPDPWAAPCPLDRVNRHRAERPFPVLGL